MRCKSCNYPLWQITARRCPECGAPFQPGSFEFVPNSVRFCCPHCSQAYYGTDPRGHLVPRAFACVACGRDINMNDMVLLPAEGIAAERTEAIDMPWLDRDRPYGPIKRWFKTIGRAMIRPGDLIRATPPESSAWSAGWFAMLTQCLIVLTAIAPGFLFIFATLGVATAGRAGAGVGLHSLGIVAAFAGVGLSIALFGLIFVTAATHAVLRITGGCAHGIKRTWQAVCYSSGANVLSAIPCLGGYFGWIWWVISAILMVKDGQKVHGGRAALAVLIAPVLAIVLIVGGYALLLSAAVKSGMVVSSMGTWPPTGTASITRAILVSTSGGGKPPIHLSRFLWDGQVSPADVIDQPYGPDTSKRMSEVHVGPIALSAWGGSSPHQRRQAAAEAAASIPTGTVAYRVGDVVATYPGLDISKASPTDGSDGLWLVVKWPETMTRETADGHTLEVGIADGSVTRVAAEEFDRALESQNRLRAKLGLPLIPHPADVKSEEPVLRDDAKYAPKEDGSVQERSIPLPFP